MAQPLVVHAVKAALDSQAVEVVVVLGHMADEVRAGDRAGRRRPSRACASSPIRISPKASAPRCGPASARSAPTSTPRSCSWATCRASAPALLDRLIAAFSPVEGRAICVPTVGGKRGNPCCGRGASSRRWRKLSGDSGAKHLIGEHADLVCEVEMAGEAAITDIDTPEALAAWRARSPA